MSQTGVSRVDTAAQDVTLRERAIDTSSFAFTLEDGNGLVFGAKAFISVVRRHGLNQEYITPYSPEQNGMIQRWFRTLKEECICLQRFKNRDQAFEIIDRWIDRHHTERLHWSPSYLTIAQFRTK